MEEGTINKISGEILGKETAKKIEPTFKVEPVEKIEPKKVKHSTEDPNETPENIHPTLGKNIDIKA